MKDTGTDDQALEIKEVGGEIIIQEKPTQLCTISFNSVSSGYMSSTVQYVGANGTESAEWRACGEGIQQANVVVGSTIKVTPEYTGKKASFNVSGNLTQIVWGDGYFTTTANGDGTIIYTDREPN